MGDQAKTPKGAELVPYELLYPPEEAQKAAKLVQDEISGYKDQLDRLRHFATDNTNLINLVRRLPDELSHEIMVPFGKAAFFPGRLIHTNEFLVLLGEGYYAEQTAKQTIGVLKRRGQVLDSKVQVLDAMISDLQARANFYEVTANESGEGMVEIREYEGYQPEAKESVGQSNSGSMVSSEDADVKTTVTDEEYAKILARLDELEKAELAAESASLDCDIENIDIDGKIPKHQKTIPGKGQKLLEEEEIPKDESILHERELRPSKISSEQPPKPKLPLRDEAYQMVAAAGKTSTGSVLGTKDHSLLESSQSTGKSSLTTNRDDVQDMPPRKVNTPLGKDKSLAENLVMETSTTTYGYHKAFTGTIIEHNNEATTDLSTQNASQAVTSNPSRPVSRFKLQKGQ